MTPSVMAARNPTRTALNSTSLLDAGKLRVKDCSMMDPSGVVRIILMPALLLFKDSSMFRIHPFSISACSVAPKVKSAIKSVKTWTLIVVLGLISESIGSQLRGLF